MSGSLGSVFISTKERLSTASACGSKRPLPPSAIPFRANIDALKRCGVTDIISLSAVGSLREDLAPGDFVVIDQFVDRTFARDKGFFGAGCVAHVSMAHRKRGAMRGGAGPLASTLIEFSPAKF